jgi:protein-S-isoprenylcysteine O-methyltransferase Ste14
MPEPITSSLNGRFLRTAQLGGTGIAIAAWWWLAGLRPGATVDSLIAVGSVLLLAALVWIGRRALDARPTVNRAIWVTTWMHAAFMALAGMAIIGATRAALVWEGWQIAVLPELGMVVAVAGSLGVLAAMLNLALQGLGAPWAIALSRRVATGGVYRWTRNPMVLSALAGLVGLGLWLRSPFFLAWTLAEFLPYAILFLRCYEERELEIRLGAPYLDYRTRTPLLWPRRPRILPPGHSPAPAGSRPS